MGSEAGTQRRVGRLACRRARVDHDVDRRQRAQLLAERLTRDALQAIALHGIARRLDPDGKAEPCSTGGVGTRDDEEQRIGETLALAVDEVELRLVGEPARARETTRCERTINRTRGNDQTARRLRPFARRRLSTRRPPFVAMRARNPWTRLRCRLLG